MLVWYPQILGFLDRSIKLLTQPKRKGASVSKFSLIILVGKSDFRVALLVPRFHNSFLIFFIDAFLNENLFSRCIFLMMVMLGWFWYLRMAEEFLFVFLSSLTRIFLCLSYAFLSSSNLLFRNLFLYFDVTIIAFLSSLSINDAWLALFNNIILLFHVPCTLRSKHFGIKT